MESYDIINVFLVTLYYIFSTMAVGNYFTHNDNNKIMPAIVSILCGWFILPALLGNLVAKVLIKYDE